MIAPTDYRFEIYNKPTGMGTGSYSKHLLRGANIEIDRSLFEGDLLTITSKRKDQDAEIDKIRPVRFYWKNTKLFDGCIRAPKYDFRQNLRRNLVTTAYGWERELQNLMLESIDGVQYDEASIDVIYKDLCRLANDLGMVKKATYAYDTSKLPYYDADVFGTTVTRFYSDSIWSAMLDLTKELDIAETLHIGEWTVRADALQSDNYIYIIPMMVNTDQAPYKTYKDFMLQPPKRIRKDYSRLLNYVVVSGKGTLINQRLAPTLILPETNIPTNEEYFNAARQPTSLPNFSRHYLKVIIKNNTVGDKGGFVRINGSDGQMNELTERFWLWVPAYTEQAHFTNERYATLATDTLSSFVVDNFSGCSIRVEEVFYGIAGRSINDYGLRGKTIRNIDFDTQEKIDLYSMQLIRTHHAPLVLADIILKPDQADAADLVGKTVTLFDPFKNQHTDFFCTKQYYYFEGPSVKESVSAMRYNLSWEYSE